MMCGSLQYVDDIINLYIYICVKYIVQVRSSLVQYRPQQTEDAIVTGTTMCFPMPPWKQRECRARFRRDGVAGAGAKGDATSNVDASGGAAAAIHGGDGNGDGRADAADPCEPSPTSASAECFGNGECSEAGVCQCYDGFVGEDCADVDRWSKGAIVALVLCLLVLMAVVVRDFGVGKLEYNDGEHRTIIVLPSR